MGGCSNDDGGRQYYHRDTTDGAAVTARGFTPAAEQRMSRAVNPGVLVADGRVIESEAESPAVIPFDGTASMNDLPKIQSDKFPLIAGQIQRNGYLRDPEMALTVVGDYSDRAPIQVADFLKLRNLDDGLRRLWPEGGGGGNDTEAYELTAYFLAHRCRMPNAVTPFCVFVADEGMMGSAFKSDLDRLLGGSHRTTPVEDVFRDLDQNFLGNVFLIHRYYGSGDARALAKWEECLGKDRIVRIKSDRAIADLQLGLFAIVTGARTLEEYLGEMRTARDKPQTEERIAEVRESLACVASYALTWPAPKYDEPFAELVGPERDRMTRRLAAKIRGTMINESTRPRPDGDGWTYLRDCLLPEQMLVGSPEWTRVGNEVERAGWRIDAAKDPANPGRRMVCLTK